MKESAGEDGGVSADYWAGTPFGKGKKVSAQSTGRKRVVSNSREQKLLLMAKNFQTFLRIEKFRQGTAGDQRNVWDASQSQTWTLKRLSGQKHISNEVGGGRKRGGSTLVFHLMSRTCKWGKGLDLTRKEDTLPWRR